jgi:hypothetical protein
MRSLEHITARAVSPSSVKADRGYLTSPRTFGVYRVPASASSTRLFRFGNHPVRQLELTREFGDCSLEYLFTEREDAREVAMVLSQRGSTI